MRKLKILTILGARPQFIKAAVISRAIKNYNKFSCNSKIDESIAHTGQHYDYGMSEVFFNELKLPKPDINLNISSCSHGEMTGKMLVAIEKVLKDRKPDWVLVYGDTNSTLAGALAAVKLHIPVAHVEAGLRSFNTRMPEEINRVLTDKISSLLLCPSIQAVENLRVEGIGAEDKSAMNTDKLRDKQVKVVMTGDVMYDSFVFWKNQTFDYDIVQKFSLPSSFILSTVHRQENTDDIDKLKGLIDVLGLVGRQFAPVVMPVHPRTRKCIDDYAIPVPQGISLLPPVSYNQMVKLLEKCELVITDSGGLQKEAYFAKKCCVTVREQTEWIETIATGNNVIAGTDSELIKSSVENFLSGCQKRKFSSLYGSGNAGRQIINALLEFS